jgi:alkylresorcinol/alkylpyrone synthase
MFFTGLGTATPPKRYAQTECWKAVQTTPQFERLNLRSRAILKKVLLANNGIQTRALSLDSLEEVFEVSPDILHARFVKHAPALATQAAERALNDAGLQPADVDALIISTCTGYLCPGLTSYVAQGLDLRTDVLALDLVGQGCGAAMPNLRTAEAFIRSSRAARVLSICVEVCSAAFYLDNDPGVLISACLFGDGAGAAVLTALPQENTRRIEWKAAGSTLNPAERDLLRFDQKNGMLRNILTPEVPRAAARSAKKILEEVLRNAKVRRDNINGWILHAGGRDVLIALRNELELTEKETWWSAAILSELGNLSSPFVYHVLERTLSENAPGGWWWMSSFGAGFSCHGALMQVE